MSDLKQDLLASLPMACDRLRARLSLATVTEPAPTDAELRERLAARLGAGWLIEECGKGTECVARYAASGSFKSGAWDVVSYPTYAALRRENGIEDCARALLVLAGVE